MLKLQGLFVIAMSLTMAACQSGNCRSNRTAGDAKSVDAQLSKSPQNRIKVYKYDGTLQCGMGKAISSTDMQKELNGISVYSVENKNDGLMRVQVCGAPTGKANVYEIDKASLDKAKTHGFKEWTFN